MAAFVDHTIYMTCKMWSLSCHPLATTVLKHYPNPSPLTEYNGDSIICTLHMFLHLPTSYSFQASFLGQSPSTWLFWGGSPYTKPPFYDEVLFKGMTSSSTQTEKLNPSHHSPLCVPWVDEWLMGLWFDKVWRHVKGLIRGLNITRGGGS